MLKRFQLIAHGTLGLILFVLGSCGRGDAPRQIDSPAGLPVIDELNRKIAKAPSDIELLQLRCETFARQNRFADAVKDAEKILSLDSTRLASYRNLANMYFDNNESRPAMKTLERGINRFAHVEDEEVQRNVYHCMLMLIEMQVITQQYKEAMLTTDNLLEQNPYMPEAIMWKAQIFEELGDTTAAVSHYAKVVDLDADHKEANIKLGLLASKLGKPIAVAYFKNVLRIDSMDLTAMKEIAWFYHKQGALEKATKWYEKAIIRHHQEPEPAYNYALLCLEQGDKMAKLNKNEAQEWYRKAYRHMDITAKVEPTFGEAYFYRGKASERMGNLKAAIKDYDQTLVFESGLKAIDVETVRSTLESVKKTLAERELPRD